MEPIFLSFIIGKAIKFLLLLSHRKSDLQSLLTGALKVLALQEDLWEELPESALFVSLLDKLLEDNP